jgi:hypothetical protein
LTRHRDEVGHEIEGEGEVDQCKRRGDLPAGRHARVSQEPFEEDRAIRHEPGDHAKVPLARTHYQRRNQGDVDGDQNADDAGADAGQ